MNTKILPRTIINPSHGYSVTFLVSGSENNGAFTYVEVVLPPKEGTPMHYHLDFTEEFEAVSGTLGLMLNGETIHLDPGEPAALVPVKAVHRFFNPGDEPIRFRCRIQPARRFEKLLRVIYGLGDDGLMKANGMPKSILHLALIYEIGESYFPGMPLWLQRGIFGLIAKVARRKGKDKELEKYYVGTLEPLT
jgi:mannose-6-phosphate isomerase-like protein (cupin superfamily)